MTTETKQTEKPSPGDTLRDQMGNSAYENYVQVRQLAMDASTAALKQAAALVEEHRLSTQSAIEAARLTLAAAQAAATLESPNRSAINKADWAAKQAEAAATDHARRFVQRLARDLTPSSILQMATIAANPLSPEAARVTAIEKITDRGLGKQALVNPLPEDISGMTTIEALTKLRSWYAKGIISQVEYDSNMTGIEMTVKVVEVDEIQKRLAALEGSAPSPASAQSPNARH